MKMSSGTSKLVGFSSNLQLNLFWLELVSFKGKCHVVIVSSGISADFFFFFFETKCVLDWLMWPIKSRL